jgi:hypothetical protein
VERRKSRRRSKKAERIVSLGDSPQEADARAFDRMSSMRGSERNPSAPSALRPSALDKIKPGGIPTIFPVFRH